ncbi:MAG: histidinol dehydrogenase [Actinomycetaceae bacterium]|nr:histidinol dehydrogenase [Actinomycetaceae bacterium]
MLSMLDFSTRELTQRELAAALPRASMDVEAALRQVQPVIADVAERGGLAIREWTTKFDGCDPTTLKVPNEVISQALETLDKDVRAALEISIDHNRMGHEAQLPEEKETEIIPGGIVRQRWIPVNRVGLYAPGGLAVYPSSVIMNVVAAQVAGVKEIAVASPPQKEFDNYPHPTILAACALLGVEEVWAMGGAQAIAGFAYGFTDGQDECAPVDVVTGPGNIFVAAAKRAVQSLCGIDAEAGTTEIAIIADDSADPDYVARDLISQAEHDPAAASVLITDSQKLASRVNEAVEQMVPHTKHSERIREALTGPQSGIVITRDITQSIDVANAFAAEHLEIQTANAREDAQRITNAGAIFVGSFSPVSLGDYIAGSNHVLPTGGTARYASGLNVHAFIKSVQEIEYSAQALTQLATPLAALADAEDLPAHGEAARERHT